MTKEIVALDQLAVEIKFYSQQTAQNIIEVGKRLAKAKEQVAHGEWGRWLQEKVDFDQSTARRFMECAERFGNRAMSHDLNQSQLFALLSLPADETETFIEQKKAKGNPVEDMTVKELRQEVKEYKDKLAAQEKEMERQQKYHDEMMDTMHEKEKVIKESHEEQLDEKNGMIESLQAENLELSNTVQYLEQKVNQKPNQAKREKEVGELRKRAEDAEQRARDEKALREKMEREMRAREKEEKTATETTPQEEEIALAFAGLLGASNSVLYNQYYTVDVLVAHWKKGHSNFSILQENIALLNRVLNEEEKK